MIKKMLIYLLMLNFAACVALSACSTPGQHENKSEDPVTKEETKSEPKKEVKKEVKKEGISSISYEQLQTDLKNKKDRVVYFFSPKCPYCVETMPTIESLANELNMSISKLNVMDYQEAPKEYNFDSIPCLIYFENGKEKKRIIGAQKEEDFKKWLNEI